MWRSEQRPEYNTTAISILVFIYDIPMSDPGQFQTTQAAARNATQDLTRKIGINLHHGNQPEIQKDGTW